MTKNKVRVTICKNRDDAARCAAALLLREALSTVAENGVFNLAVSGGSTPLEMYKLLAGPPFSTRVPWKDIHLFWVDERCVPRDDPASNYGAMRQSLLDHIPLPASRVHPMPVEGDPDRGAAQYEQVLKDQLPLSGEGIPVFDLLLLGVGADGHTASLFPGVDIPGGPGRHVLAVKGGDPDVRRLTLNFDVINSARNVALLITGAGKAEIVRTIFETPAAGLPAQKIRPANGAMYWIMDREATVLIDPKHTCQPIRDCGTRFSC